VKPIVNALELAYDFLKNGLHGLPKSIVSDCNTKFTSKFWKELHRLLGVKLKLTTTFHLEGDGQAKQMIQNIIQIIRASVRPDQHDWALKIPLPEFAINSSINKSMGYAPFELIYGVMPHMVVDVPHTNLPRVEEFCSKRLITSRVPMMQS
jgi:hypothetical protein